MSEISQHLSILIARLRWRLGLRWFVRASLWGISAFGASFALSGFVSGLVGVDGVFWIFVVSLFSALLSFAFYAYRYPFPGLREAALFAEHVGEESGAVELVLGSKNVKLPNVKVENEALRTLKSITSNRMPPLLSLRLAGITSLMLLAATMVGALMLLSQPEEDQGFVAHGHQETGMKEPVAKQPAVPERTSKSMNSAHADLLAEFRATLFQASPEERAEAAKRYAELFRRRAEAIAELQAAGEQGLRAAKEGDVQKMQSASERQRSAIAAATSAGVEHDLTDSPMPDEMTRTQLKAQSFKLKRLAEGLDESASAAANLALRLQLDPQVLLKEEDRSARQGGSERRESGALELARSGSIVIHEEVWQKEPTSSYKRSQNLNPRVLKAMQRYEEAMAGSRR